METIDVQSRSFVVRWVKCNHGDTIDYQLKPLKKSIELGIYKKLKSSVSDDQSTSVHIAPDTPSTLNYTNQTLHHRNTVSSTSERSSSFSSQSSLSISNIQQQSQEKPLKERLTQSGFTQVKWIGQLAGNKMYQGQLEVNDNDFYYAFILDNTSSKNVKKKVLFNASVINDDTKSVISTRSAPSPKVTSFPSLTTPRDNVLMVGQGRYIQGYLFKKRRKRLQGFKRRFFTLDFRYGTLSYYLNDHNQTRRGEIVIGLSTVSANKKDRLIIIDSGMELWPLKAPDVGSWQIWVNALQTCFDRQNEKVEDNFDEDDEVEIEEDNEHEHLDLEGEESDDNETTHNDTIVNSITTLNNTKYVPLPNEAYEDFDSNLKLIEQRLEQCKKESLFYAPLHKQNNSGRIMRSSSSSSVLTGKRIKTMSPISPTDSQDSLLSVSEFIEEKGESNEHDLYKRLEELESFFHLFVRQSKVLKKDHAEITRQRRSIISNISDNEIFFDAEEKLSTGVIILDDEETNDDNTTATELKLVESAPDLIVDESKIMTVESEESSTTPSPKLQPIRSKTTLQKGKSSEIDLYPLPYENNITRRNDVKPSNTTPQSLLSFLRKNVGKDLSSISMPITSNEPITILQLISETFEYAPLLSQLPNPPDNIQPLSIVSAFAVSFLSIYREKTRALRKPFNPLLGETFELVRPDLGFRLIAEKVSHKPQIFAFHAEHKDWECSYTVTPVQKFWGKSLELNNEGTIELKSKKTGEYFEWTQPTTMLKGLIAGDRYIEPVNEFEVISSQSGKATISFEKTGMFGGRSEKVDIKITPSSRKGMKQNLTGNWTQSITETSTSRKIWEAGELVKDSKKKYGFTKFTANLNEITDIELGNAAPTDSRFRPDMRAYENCKVDQAETLKLKLEADQRDRRNKGKDVNPQYFTKSSANKWKFIRGPNSYWERRRRQDWSNVTPLW